MIQQPNTSTTLTTLTTTVSPIPSDPFHITSIQDRHPGNDTASSTTTTTADSIISRRGIGIDTRFLQTFVGDAIAQRYHHLIMTFLQSCQQSGLLPQILSTVVASTNNKMKTTSMMTCMAQPLKKDMKFNGSHHYGTKDQLVVAMVPVQVVPSPQQEISKDDTEDCTRNLLPCPKSLTAATSWNILGDLGE